MVQALQVVLLVQEILASLFQGDQVDQPVQEVLGAQSHLFLKIKEY